MTTRRTVLVLIAVAVSVVARAPIAFDPLGVQIRLAPIPVDIETLPQVGDELATRVPPP